MVLRRTCARFTECARTAGRRRACLCVLACWDSSCASFRLPTNSYVIRVFSFALASKLLCYTLSFSEYFSGSLVTPLQLTDPNFWGGGTRTLLPGSVCATSVAEGRGAGLGLQRRCGHQALGHGSCLSASLSSPFLVPPICSLFFAMVNRRPWVSETLIPQLSAPLGDDDSLIEL